MMSDFIILQLISIFLVIVGCAFIPMLMRWEERKAREGEG